VIGAIDLLGRLPSHPIGILRTRGGSEDQESLLIRSGVEPKRSYYISLSPLSDSFDILGDMGKYELFDPLPFHVDERTDEGKGFACFLLISRIF
jgi:hypothetical protein